MKIKTTDNYEIELDGEELRHFKINNAKDLKKFIQDIKEQPQRPLGFKQEE